MTISFRKELINYLSRRKFKSGSAFTLVELIVVVVIIGILSSIAIPSFQNASDKAKQKEASSLVASYLKAAQAYYTEYGQVARNSLQLGEYVAVSACRNGDSNYCKNNNNSLINWSRATRTQWFSPSGNYDIRLGVTGPRLNILAYPRNQSMWGVIGCYSTDTGATKVKENSGNDKGNRYVRNITC